MVPLWQVHVHPCLNGIDSCWQLSCVGHWLETKQSHVSAYPSELVVTARTSTQSPINRNRLFMIFSITVPVDFERMHSRVRDRASEEALGHRKLRLVAPLWNLITSNYSAFEVRATNARSVRVDSNVHQYWCNEFVRARWGASWQSLVGL